ncbi:MAG: low-specificity L-threonine aldolase [Defluviitaleaceae bacterium]|nr:low-specificity L-threonine aldolase [Defluviitaleaceae bacterium]
MKFIDLRSDTVTQPTAEMRNAMAAAIVGDDVYEDDPTVTQLEELAAKITGFEASLFVPSGTMANQLAIMAHTKRGDEIIVGQNSHVVAHEVGGAAIISGVSYRIVNNPDHTIRGQDIDANVREDDIHYPETGMVCIENALSNGTVVPLDAMKDTYTAAQRRNLPVHLDGARLFNAAIHLNVDPKEITRYCDTAMFALSKGLCAPIGSMLCGSAAFIKKSRKLRKLLGGGMRQAGILAACGLVSLETMIPRLEEDHENARCLAQQLGQIPYITLDINKVHINMVFFNITKPGFDHAAFASHLYEKGIKTNPGDESGYRFVTHNDISRENIDYVLGIIKAFLAEASHA